MSLRPTLIWNAVADATDYVVEIDNDPSFSSIDYTATVAGTSHAVTADLAGSTQYYWRVRARNNCGGPNYQVFSFTTNPQICSTITSTDVPKTIVDKSGTTIGTTTSTLVSAISGTVGDVDVVDLRGTHTYINDLDFNLTSPSGTTVMIMARSCGSQDNFQLSLDDSAAGNPGGWTCPPVNTAGYPNNRYRPSNPLSGFIGNTASGTWTLTIHDNVASDSGTLQGWGLRICSPATISPISVANDSFTINEDTVLSGSSLAGNDTPPGLAYTATSLPTHGSLVLQLDGSFTYTPTANYCGSDSFGYQATDGTSSATATASITVTCVNDPPVAAGDNYSAIEDTLLTVTTANGVLVNDSDVDLPAQPLSAVLVQSPSHGTLNLAADGSFTYMPDANYCGTDNFDYSASDGVDPSPTANVSIDVACVEEVPVVACHIGRQIYSEGTAVNLPISTMFFEPDGQTMTYGGANLPPGLGVGYTSGTLAGTISTGASAGSPYTAVFSAMDPNSHYISSTLPIIVLPANDALFRGSFDNPADLIACH